MRRFVRGPALVLVVALGVADAYAAWHSGGPFRSARLAKPRLAAVATANAVPARNSPHAVFGSLHPRNPHCELVGCADALAVDASEFCPICLDSTDLMLTGLDRSDLDGSGTILAATSVGAFGPELRSDPNPLYLASIEPSAVAAPTPEISTAAMLTLGFAGVVWTARRTRRPTSKSSPEPCPC